MAQKKAKSLGKKAMKRTKGGIHFTKQADALKIKLGLKYGGGTDFKYEK
jgi:hypothetical protein